MHEDKCLGTNEEQHHSAEACPGEPWGMRAAERCAIEDDASPKRRLSPYSVDSLLPREPEVPRPPDPCTTPPETPPPPKPKIDRSHLHPMIQYWGLH